MNANNINVSQKSAYKRIKRNLTKVLLIAILSFLTYSPSFAQYKLELEWQKKPGGNGLNIRGVGMTSDDSTLIISGDRSDGQGGSLGNIYKVKASTGEVLTVKDSTLSFNFIKVMQDGKNMICSSERNGTFGMYDFNTLEQKYSIGFPITLIGFHYSESNMKAIACGKNLIRLYDLNTKQVIKELNSQYFGSNDSYIMQSELSVDGKYIIYCYNSPKKVNGFDVSHYFLKIIDLEGNLVKDFGEVSYKNFGMTSDGKTLIYFANLSLYFFDLDTKTNKESVFINGIGSNFFYPTNDGKYVFMGFDGISMYDFENKKNISLNKLGDWFQIVTSDKYESVYTPSGNALMKFKLGLNNSVNTTTEQSNFSLETNQNELLIKSQSEVIPNWKFSISSADGKEIKQFQTNEISLTTTTARLNIAELAAGTYFLRIADSQNTLAVLKFLKVN